MDAEEELSVAKDGDSKPATMLLLNGRVEGFKMRSQAIRVVAWSPPSRSLAMAQCSEQHAIARNQNGPASLQNHSCAHQHVMCDRVGMASFAGYEILLVMATFCCTIFLSSIRSCSLTRSGSKTLDAKLYLALPSSVWGSNLKPPSELHHDSSPSSYQVRAS